MLRDVGSASGHDIVGGPSQCNTDYILATPPVERENRNVPIQMAATVK